MIYKQMPVIAAPMFLVSGVELVVSCCKNGIIGSFPSLNARTNARFESMLESIQDRLSEFEKKQGIRPAPYAVNLIVHKSNTRLEEDLKSCIKYRVPIVITSLGAVKEVIEAVHSYGGIVYHDVIRMRHAEKAAEQGVDGLILVSGGAGGHAGLASPFAFIKEIKSFFTKTVILAGAITRGEDILAAQVLGADYAYMGTRFIATQESMADAEYKKMILEAELSDIIYSDKISGVCANFLKPSIERAGIDLKRLELPEGDLSSLGAGQNKAWKDIWSAGHGVAGIHEILSVGDLVRELRAEYNEAIENIKRIPYDYQ